MKLIPHKIIAEHKSTYNNGYGLCATHGALFDLGVAFAEKELQNLAIEYAEWYRRVFHESFSQWCELSQEELFDKFLKNRQNDTRTNTRV